MVPGDWKRDRVVRNVGLIVLALAFAATDGLTAAGRAPLTRADIDQMIKSISNWGRWGKDDQLGALNLITPAKRKQAAALVTDGVSLSLSHNVGKVRTLGSPPFEHVMVKSGQTPGAQNSEDRYSVQYHGFSVTHLDALCHVFHGNEMYNGFPIKEVTDKGAAKLSVINMKNGIFTRGVLMDFPRLFGVDYLKGARPIYPEDLEAWEQKAGIRVGSGDAILIRTGRWTRYKAEGEWDALRNSPGLDVTCMPWLKKRDVAVLGSDLASDAMPSRVEGAGPGFLPVHTLAIVALGVPILDNCDFETLSAAAAARKRWTFLLTVAPLAVEGGTGSPVNPIATF